MSRSKWLVIGILWNLFCTILNGYLGYIDNSVFSWFCCGFSAACLIICIVLLFEEQ